MPKFLDLEALVLKNSEGQLGEKPEEKKEEE